MIQELKYSVKWGNRGIRNEKNQCIEKCFFQIGHQSGKYGGFGEDLPGAGIIFPGAPGAKVPKKHPGCIGCPRSSAFGTSLVLKYIFFRKDPGAITLCGVTN